MLRPARHPASIAAGLIGLCVAVAPASAAQVRAYNVPPGALGGVLVTYGEQAGLTIGINDPALTRVLSPGVRGRLSARQALGRILTGTGASFVQIDARTIRVFVARRPTPPRPSKPAPRSGPAVPSLPIENPEIVVTASKQDFPLRDYPGTATIIALGPGLRARESAQGTGAIVARLPALTSTNLGPGRNKIFIRGVADSSFNGSSPATIGQYLGDVRLTYNAPDPALNLYDIRRVEVLEGPQGTLYGTGALGGVIRLVPYAPDLRANAGAASFGGVTVAHGGFGYDAAAMGNVVIVPGKAALRMVGYAATEPGYIDDPSRGLNNINQSKSVGGRVAVRLAPGDDWTVTIGGATQNITARDGQYALRGQPPLQRNSAISQPFDNDYGLAYLTAERAIGGAQLTTTTSYVRHQVSTVFDATPEPAAPPRKFTEGLAIRLLSHETRLSGKTGSATWVVGLTGLSARERTMRALGDPAAPDPITGVRNVNSELAAFGQYSQRITSQLTATVGGRLSFAHSSGEVIDDIAAQAAEPTRNQLRLSPTVALAWKIDDRFLAYVHAQSAFRPGLLEVAPTDAAADTQRVAADSLAMVEMGVRFGQRGRDRFTVAASVAAVRWTDIQSDLVDASGLPYTTNIGDGRIMSFETQAEWQVSTHFALEAGLFLNDSRLAKPAANFLSANERELPNIPHIGARLGASYRTTIGKNMALTTDGALRYVGVSSLGIGAPLDVKQGGYVGTSLGARLSRGALGLSLDASNLGDTRGNRFSFGNPFGIEQRNQITPLVPRRVRLGFDVRF